jgi:hypothetical protein
MYIESMMHGQTNIKKKTFLYLTFAAFWTGTFLVLEIDYDHYLITKHCPFSSPNRKYVFWGILNV